MNVGVQALHHAPRAGIYGERVQSHTQFFAEEPNGVYSGGTATVAMGRNVSVPSFGERGLHT